MKKVQYFKIDQFVEGVMRELNLHHSKNMHGEGLRDTIRDTLRTRLLIAIFNKFSDKEIQMFEQMNEDHPELEDLDVLMMLIHNIDWLEETLMDTAHALQLELVVYARQMAEARRNFTG